MTIWEVFGVPCRVLRGPAGCDCGQCDVYVELIDQEFNSGYKRVWVDCDEVHRVG